MERLKGLSSPEDRLMRVRNFMLIVGSLMMCLLVFIPLLDAIRLMYDLVFVYFVGRLIPILIIITCVAAVLGWMLAVWLFFKCASPEAMTQSRAFTLVSLSLMTLGLAFMLLAVPLKRQSELAYNEIFFQCHSGLHTRDLYAYSSMLENIRSDPACRLMKSVEECSGFTTLQPYTGFLVGMEKNWQCAGFCSQMAGANATSDTLARLTATGLLSTASAAAPAALMQTGASPRAEQAEHPAQRVEVAEASSTEDMRHLRQVKAHEGRSRRLGSEPKVSLLQTDSGKTEFPVLERPYVSVPPTLFSQATFQASCDGVAARNLKYSGIGTGEVLFDAGLFLLLSNVVGGLVMLSSLCRARSNAMPAESIQGTPKSVTL